MNHKEITAHIRNRLKASGIKAKCKMDDYCGHSVVKISTPSFDSRFTADDCHEIALIAKANGLTCAQGVEIDLSLFSQLTETTQFSFYLK